MAKQIRAGDESVDSDDYSDMLYAECATYAEALINERYDFEESANSSVVRDVLYDASRTPSPLLPPPPPLPPPPLVRYIRTGTLSGGKENSRFFRRKGLRRCIRTMLCSSEILSLIR